MENLTPPPVREELPRWCLKGDLVDRYGGRKDENFYNWRIELEECFRLRQLLYHFWARVTRIHLTHTAKRWVSDQDPQIFWTYRELMENLANEFEAQSLAAASNTFSQCIQHKSEPVKTYFRRLALTCNQAFKDPHMTPSLREQLAMDQTLKGIRKELLEKAIRATSAGNLKSIIDEFYAVEIHEKVSGPRTPRRNSEIRGPNPAENAPA